MGSSPERLREHVEALASEPRNRRTPSSMENARRYVKEGFFAQGWEVDEQPFDKRHTVGLTDGRGGKPLWPLSWYRRISGINVLATKGKGPPLVFVAHLDSVKDSPGADDNASALAVLLEVARLLATTPLPRAVMLAAVDLEETGKMGSAALAEQLGTSVEGVVCMDAVGYYSDEPDSQHFPRRMGALARGFNDTLEKNQNRADFAVVIDRRSSRELAQRWCAGAERGGLPTMRLHDPRPAGWRGHLLSLLVPPLTNFDRSDHAPFWRKRVPAICVTDTAVYRNDRYHTPTDTPETLGYRRLAAVADACVGCATQPGMVAATYP